MPTNACVAFYDCQGLRKDTEAAPWLLLRVLLLRFDTVSTDPTRRERRHMFRAARVTAAAFGGGEWKPAL